MRGIGPELRQRTGIERLLACLPGRQPGLTGRLKGPVQAGQEGQRGRDEQGVLPWQVTGDLHALTGAVLQHGGHRRLHGT